MAVDKRRLRIGEYESGEVMIPEDTLKKHFLSLGGSGSGKTVLSKVLIEEAAIMGIPSLLIDPQGDLASLAKMGTKADLKKHGLDETKAELLSKVPVRIFTPASDKGIQISINPLKTSSDKISSQEKISITDQIATAITNLMGYDLRGERGSATKAILYTILMERDFEDFRQLSDFLRDMTDSPLKEKINALAINTRQTIEITRKLTLLSVGKNQLLFEKGFRLDIGKMFEKPTINIIYLNTLSTQEEKEFFLSVLAKDLYEWMLKNPSKALQALFLIDEIAPYIPAGAKKPATKDILKLLFKQARKYGVGCLVATQNPGDIDYMAFAQFGTWSIGRLTTKQDRAKVSDALNSLTESNITEILPKLTPGNFILFSPDNYNELIQYKTRWLYTKHNTLNENDVSKLMTPEIIAEYIESEKDSLAKAQLKEEIESEVADEFSKRTGKVEHEDGIEIVKEKKKDIVAKTEDIDGYKEVDVVQKRLDSKKKKSPEKQRKSLREKIFGSSKDVSSTNYYDIISNPVQCARIDRKIIPIDMTLSEAKKNASRIAKKNIIGSPKEKIIDVSERLRLVHLTTIQKKSKKILGVGIGKNKRYYLLMDSLTGNIIDYAFRTNYIFSLYSLSEEEIRVYRILFKLQSADINKLAFKLGLPHKDVIKVLKKLKDKRFCSAKKVVNTKGSKSETVEEWYSLVELPKKPLTITGFRELDIESQKVDAPIDKPKFDERDFEKIVKGFYDSDIINSEVLYLPYYRVELQSKSRKRIVNFTKGKNLI